MNRLLRVWGVCDNLQIEFSHKGGTTWTCKVPPDLKDGVYVAEFWAEDSLGRIGHWCGFLYMVNGLCHFKFEQEKYQIWIHPNKYKIDFDKEKNQSMYFLDMQPVLFELEIEKNNNYEMFFKKRCEHWEL